MKNIITECKKIWHDGNHRPISITEITTVVAKQSNRQLLKIQFENQCFCMAIMQMVVVACLGWKKSLGSCAERSQKDLPETLLSRKGLI